MKVSQSFLLPFSWERIAAVLCDPQFNIERDKLREGVIASEFHRVDEGERHNHFELHTTEYKRTMTGGLNRSGTARTVTEFRYDAHARTVRWNYAGEAGPLMELSGTYTLQPHDRGTRLVHEVSIFVWLPVVGHYIMKFIAKEFEKPSHGYRELIIEHAAGAMPQDG